ncbi:MAG: DUF5676 family membrane protein [Patescibacteria group bacterium]
MAKLPSSHEPVATANAAAVTIAIGYVACAVFVVVAPDLSREITKALFHGIEISQFDGRTASMGSFVLGLISAAVGAWLVGFVFASLYTFFAKK